MGGKERARHNSQIVSNSIEGWRWEHFMHLEQTIQQMDVGIVAQERAEELGQLGYLQWLWALRSDACYVTEARNAYVFARPLISTSPAIAVFCEFLRNSAIDPLKPLDIRFPLRVRRGGASARRGHSRPLKPMC